MGYNRIMAYNVKYNWLTFLNTAFLHNWGCLVLKEFAFFEVATQSSTDKYAIRHGEYVNPTLLKNRRIRFLFDIIANTEEERWELLNKVQWAFAPENNPSPFNENLRKELSFMDINCKEWKCKCQVLKGIELSDFANQKWVWISAELITDGIHFESGEEHSTTIFNTQMWIRLPVKLPFKWKYYKAEIHHNWLSSPVKVEMTILNKNNDKYPFNMIKIINQRENKLDVMHIEEIGSLWINVGDKITVDSEKRRCYFKNHEWEVDITGLVRLGSSRPSIENWDNTIAIDTGTRTETIEAEIKWKDLF